MTKPKTFNDILIEEVKDLYSAESQLAKAMPRVVKAAHDRHLRAALQKHLEETRQHMARLREVADLLGTSPAGKVCQATQGLVVEMDDRLDNDREGLPRDVRIIGASQRIEHYEIAAYGCARTYAQLLGHHEVAALLQTTLDEEMAEDRALTSLAEIINSRVQFQEDMRLAC